VVADSSLIDDENGPSWLLNAEPLDDALAVRCHPEILWLPRRPFLPGGQNQQVGVITGGGGGGWDTWGGGEEARGRP